MRNKIVAALAALALAGTSAAALAPAAQAAPETSHVAVAAAPAVSAAKASKSIVVKAKVRVNPEKMTVKQAAKAFKKGFLEAKGTVFNGSGVTVLMAMKQGNATGAKLWKAKKGQKVRVVTTKGKKINVKLLKRVSGDDLANGNVAVSLFAKSKVIIVMGANADSQASRVFLLG